MRRATASDSTSTRSESEIAFVLRGAKRKSGPEMMRHVASANVGTLAPPRAPPRKAKRKSAPAAKARKSAKRRKA